MNQMNIFEFLDDNLAKLQEQLPFQIVDYKLGYKWIKQCRMQVSVFMSDGKEIPLITTLKLGIIDVYFREGLHELFSYDHTVSPSVVYFNGQKTAHMMDWNCYADIS